MSVRIRLSRLGKKKAPFYRLVVADSRSPRDGRFIEILGTYNPLTDPAEIKVDTERAKFWLGNGASPSDTAKILLQKVGVFEGPSRPAGEAKPAKPEKKAPAKAAAPVEEAPAVEEAPVAETPAEEAPAAEAPAEEAPAEAAEAPAEAQ